MITEKDLNAAIAECHEQRNPNANTCLKLASYYTILDHVQADRSEPVSVPRYSFAAQESTAETRIDYNSGTEFSALINGRVARDVWETIDELMSVLHMTQPRLYNGTMNQIREKTVSDF